MIYTNRICSLHVVGVSKDVLPEALDGGLRLLRCAVPVRAQYHSLRECHWHFTHASL